MNGNFNGAQLRNITSRRIVAKDHTILTTFRALGGPLKELEERLKLNEPGLLILSGGVIEGRIVHFSADLIGYEVTIQSDS